ncbi:hypothetical protein EJ08DRAFT_690231 [Tothia fuscella]|uniref:Uncharacterized protein n=1 Tax=Tothia fuscella TaxID=1048955 RepID=A0A9P4NH00_9PEZI|nr:hypothetical protein EJ08DRAFT_690231 [Tothia fuscella]
MPVKVQALLLRERTISHSKVPGLRLNTVQHRQRIPTADQIAFRVNLLRSLRQGWNNDDTEAKFLQVVNMVETDGCNLFGGLIDPVIFEQLVARYDKIQLQSGDNTFMHSYVNLAVEHDFILGGRHVEAFSHPLLIAIISYLLGGSIRIVDFRGKDSNPISINAQDNMLHIDNTPFKEEYKVLLNWQRGQVQGPSGQNFTFLPWTHKGNRDVLADQGGMPYHEAIDGLFDFQKDVKGISRVVEARHPDQPLAILFPAGALVHYHYRTEDGDPRSCIITAFHLSSKHPGQIAELLLVHGRKRSLVEFLVGHQDEHSNDEMLDLLQTDSHHIESKLHELFHPSHPSKILDIGPLALEGDRLARWRKAVVDAASPLTHKYKNNLRLSGIDFNDLDALTGQLAAIMDYDKHCNLQMILYEDGRGEILKPGRKLIGEMKKEAIQAGLAAWVHELRAGSFSAHDLVQPKTLGKIFMSLRRLMMDTGEAIVRCEGIEAFIATSLFLFLTSQEIYAHLCESDKIAVRSIVVVFLRNYVATVLLVETMVSS